jgi:hypothetical protein
VLRDEVEHKYSLPPASSPQTKIEQGEPNQFWEKQMGSGASKPISNAVFLFVRVSWETFPLEKNTNFAYTTAGGPSIMATKGLTSSTVAGWTWEGKSRAGKPPVRERRSNTGRAGAVHAVSRSSTAPLL